MTTKNNMSTKQGIVFLVFVVIAFLFFVFPLIISLLTKNYWYFFLFFVSWVPALIIGRIGGHLCSD